MSFCWRLARERKLTVLLSGFAATSRELSALRASGCDDVGPAKRAASAAAEDNRGRRQHCQPQNSVLGQKLGLSGTTSHHPYSSSCD